MVPTCSNSREHESSRARLMAHRVGDLLASRQTVVSQSVGAVRCAAARWRTNRPAAAGAKENSTSA